MNDKPHVHKVTVRQYYGDSGKWLVAYGDTKVTIASRFANPATDRFARKVQKATAKAVRKHDEGSLKAGEYERRKREIQAQAAAVVTQSPFAEAAIAEGKKKYEEDEALFTRLHYRTQVDSRDGKLYVVD